MTDYQKYINALRKCAKEHENCRTSTGHIIVSDLCRDTANLLEELSSSEKPNKSDNPTSSTNKNDLGVDCIDRQATLDAIIKRLGIRNETYLLQAEKVLYQQIKDMPSVTPQEPRKGHWVLTDVEGNKVWHCHCSECGKDPQDYIGGSEDWWLLKSKLPKFCPNCGAKMESEVEK